MPKTSPISKLGRYCSSPKTMHLTPTGSFPRPLKLVHPEKNNKTRDTTKPAPTLTQTLHPKETRNTANPTEPTYQTQRKTKLEEQQPKPRKDTCCSSAHKFFHTPRGQTSKNAREASNRSPVPSALEELEPLLVSRQRKNKKGKEGRNSWLRLFLPDDHCDRNDCQDDCHNYCA